MIVIQIEIHIQLTLYYNPNSKYYNLMIIKERTSDSEMFFNTHDCMLLSHTLNYLLNMTHCKSIKIELLFEDQEIEPAILIINKNMNGTYIFTLEQYDDNRFSYCVSTSIELSKNDIIEFREAIGTFLRNGEHIV